MGLDLIICSCDKEAFVLNENGFPTSSTWAASDELFYGRKTWSIKHALMGDSAFLIFNEETMTVFASFVERLKKHRRSLYRIEEFYEYYEDEFEDEEPDPDEERLIQNMATSICEDLDAGIPQLGFVWECSAYLRLFNAADSIRSEFEKGRVVYIEASW